MTEHNNRQYREEDFSRVVPEFNDPNPRVRALKIVLDELEYPNRDMRLAAQVLLCKPDLESVCEWLRAEVEREIRLETMFIDDND